MGSKREVLPPRSGTKKAPDKGQYPSAPAPSSPQAKTAGATPSKPGAASASASAPSLHKQKQRSRIARLLNLLSLIRSGQRLGPADLARHLGVKPRQITRDLEEWAAMGIRTRFNRASGRYAIEAESNSFLPPLELDAEEAFGLILLGEQIAGTKQIDHFEPAVRGIAKIISALPEPIRSEVDANRRAVTIRATLGAEDHAPDIYNTVRAAIASGTVLICQYESAATLSALAPAVSSTPSPAPTPASSTAPGPAGQIVQNVQKALNSIAGHPAPGNQTASAPHQSPQTASSGSPRPASRRKSPAPFPRGRSKIVQIVQNAQFPSDPQAGGASASPSPSNSATPSPRSERFTFEPYTLFFHLRAWYAIGLCRERGQVRMYKLARFRSARPGTDSYTIPASFSLDEHFGNAWRVVKEGPERDVVLTFAPSIAQTMSETRWHKTERFDMNPDGSVTYHFRIAGINEIAHWILGYGPLVKVVSPPELRDRVATMLHDSLAQYESPTGEDAVPYPEPDPLR